MAWSDGPAMDLSVKSVVGLAFAGLLALMFVVSCALSVVKAVRDRRHIKARIRTKKSLKANNGNGHTPAASATAEQCKKGRPNILIIHDGEREERVKKGTGPNSTGSSPRFPSGISSPGEQNSRYTETTTLAEVSCHRSSLGSTPGGELGEGGTRTAPTESGMNGRSSSPGRISDSGGYYSRTVGNNTVHVTGDAVTYRRSSSPSSPRRDGGTVIGTTFPVSENVSKRSKNRYEVRDKMKTRDASPKYSVSEGNICYGRDSLHSPQRSKDTPSYTKNAKVSSHQSPSRGADQITCARYNPRRNSYAAAIANVEWVDVAPVRRHSDEARHLVNSSSQNRQGNTSSRDQVNIGADNPAFDGAYERTEL